MAEVVGRALRPPAQARLEPGQGRLRLAALPVAPVRQRGRQRQRVAEREHRRPYGTHEHLDCRRFGGRKAAGLLHVAEGVEQLQSHRGVQRPEDPALADGGPVGLLVEAATRKLRRGRGPALECLGPLHHDPLHVGVGGELQPHQHIHRGAVFLQERGQVRRDHHPVPGLLELGVADHRQVAGLERGPHRLLGVHHAVGEGPAPGVDQRRETMVHDRPEPLVLEPVVHRQRQLAEFRAALVLPEHRPHGDRMMQVAEGRRLAVAVPEREQHQPGDHEVAQPALAAHIGRGPRGLQQAHGPVQPLVAQRGKVGQGGDGPLADGVPNGVHIDREGLVPGRGLGRNLDSQALQTIEAGRDGGVIAGQGLVLDDEQGGHIGMLEGRVAPLEQRQEGGFGLGHPAGEVLGLAPLQVERERQVVPLPPGLRTQQGRADGEIAQRAGIGGRRLGPQAGREIQLGQPAEFGGAVHQVAAVVEVVDHVEERLGLGREPSLAQQQAPDGEVHLAPVRLRDHGIGRLLHPVMEELVPDGPRGEATCQIRREAVRLVEGHHQSCIHRRPECLHRRRRRGLADGGQGLQVEPVSHAAGQAEGALR